MKSIIVCDTGVAIPRDGQAEALQANALLHNGRGAGGEWLGWVSLPSTIGEELLTAIRSEAARLRSLARVVVCIGIGGSYLGTRAVYEALSDPFRFVRQNEEPVLLFAGQNLSEDYLARLFDAVRDESIAAIVVSKSGTTLEPAIAFRLVRAEIERRYGRAGAAERIVAVTDAGKGALREMALREGYATFAIPDDIGGRYSVLTPVGLLPLAVAGIDIGALVAGAREMQRATAEEVPFDENPAARYAAVRHALYKQGKKIEILGAYEPALHALGEWWKQLFGESEGKLGRGIFPVGATFTTDLHSLGQYIQEGERTLFETIVSVGEPGTCLRVGEDVVNEDGLNYLAGKRISEINRMAESGVRAAHVGGGVPNLRIEIPRIDAHTIGALLYFFEKACGISGYLSGVNPFDQPGVEAYKRHIRALLKQ